MPALVAVTRDVPDSLAAGERTFVDRAPIDLARARDQQAAYRELLASLGVQVVALGADPGAPDSCFVEDAAVVVDEVAVLTRPGALSRRHEPAALEPVLARHRPIAAIEAPGTLDGGDVLRVGKRVFVGRTRRTSDAGIDGLRRILAPHGYQVTAVAVTGCLHLKTAVTAADERTLVVNPAWIDAAPFAGFELVSVAADEPCAADVLRIGETVVLHSGFARTRALLEARGLDVRGVDLSEFLKAEAGVTCLSVIFAA